MLDQEAHQYPLDPETDDASPDDPDFIAPGENKLHAKLMKDLIKGRRLADAFWQSFRDGGLLELRNRGVDSKRRQLGHATIQPDDLVLVSEKDVPRSEWRLARVLELLPHSDGHCRSAKIRYAKTKRETNRALEHLYPIGQIPQTTAACCSTVSRIGIYLSVLLSDTVSMSDTSNSSSTTDAATTAALNSTVPISSATFDSSGQIVLANLTTPAAVNQPSQPTVPAHTAGRSGSALEATDASRPAHTAGENDPALPTAEEERPVSLPSCSGLLIDPLELALEHNRQIMVAMTEKQRILDVIYSKLDRCWELAAQGRPTDQLFARIRAEHERRLGPLPPPLAGPRADPPADQNAHPLADQSTQTDTTTEAAARTDQHNQQTQTDVSALHEINAFFWCNIAINGRPAQEDNPFLSTPMPITVQAQLPVQQSTVGSVAAHTAAPMPAVAQDPGAAHTAARGTAPRAPHHRPPFNSAALLRTLPVIEDWPNFPPPEEIERRVRQFFAAAPADQEILEPIDESTLYTIAAESTQKQLFILCRSSPTPVPSAWDPVVFCDGDGEQDCFH